MIKVFAEDVVTNVTRESATCSSGEFSTRFVACTTLSFLVTTPEAWVPALGDATHGFPYLSGTGRLVVKDAIMLAVPL